MNLPMLAAGAAGGPTPPSIASGLSLWFKADAGLFQDTSFTTQAVSEGDPVGGWQDQSGQGHHLTQGTASKRPLFRRGVQNNKPVVRFDGVDDFIETGLFTSIPQPFTIWAVYKSIVIGASGSHDVIWTGNNNQRAFLISDTTPQVELYAGNLIVYSGSICNGSHGAVTTKWSGASSKLRVDRTDLMSGNTGAEGCDRVSLGAIFNGGQPTNIEVAEFGVYAAALTTAQEFLLDTYMKNRWATP